MGVEQGEGQEVAWCARVATVGRAVGLDSVTASDLWVHGVAFLRGVRSSREGCRDRLLVRHGARDRLSLGRKLAPPRLPFVFSFLRGVVAVFVARGAAGVVWSWSTDTRSG